MIVLYPIVRPAVLGMSVMGLQPPQLPTQMLKVVISVHLDITVPQVPTLQSRVQLEPIGWRVGVKVLMIVSCVKLIRFKMKLALLVASHAPVVLVLHRGHRNVLVWAPSVRSSPLTDSASVIPATNLSTMVNAFQKTPLTIAKPSCIHDVVQIKS
jgi:hypothetical protein